MNAKIQGRSTPFGAKKGGGQLQTKSVILDRSTSLYFMFVFPLFYQIHGILYIESHLEDFGSHLWIILY